MQDDFVIFLANAVRYLAPPGRAAATFSHVTPRQAGVRKLRDFAPAALPPQDPFGRARCPLVTPGLYRDAAGRLHAVSLVGLCSRQPATPATEAAAAVKLPDPQATGRDVELWPILLAAAAALWLLGWTFRA